MNSDTRRIQFHIDSLSGLPASSPLRTLDVSVTVAESEAGRTSTVRRREGADPTWQENLPWLPLSDFSLIRFDVTQRIPWTKSSRVIASSNALRLDQLIQLQGDDHLDRDHAIRLPLTLTRPKKSEAVLVLNIRELSTKNSVTREAAAFVRRQSSSSIDKPASSDLVESSTIMQLGAATPKVHFLTVDNITSADTISSSS
ncbi:hypothetical protein BDZ89DRAFT_1065538 [Hymenopellis radicata]|nr:hypothetical protein BDZ89DRAFT_1065538 [Hymenopellis radicata]